MSACDCASVRCGRKDRVLKDREAQLQPYRTVGQHRKSNLQRQKPLGSQLVAQRARVPEALPDWLPCTSVPARSSRVVSLSSSRAALIASHRSLAGIWLESGWLSAYLPLRMLGAVAWAAGGAAASWRLSETRQLNPRAQHPSPDANSYIPRSCRCSASTPEQHTSFVTTAPLPLRWGWYVSSPLRPAAANRNPSNAYRVRHIAPPSVRLRDEHPLRGAALQRWASALSLTAPPSSRLADGLYTYRPSCDAEGCTLRRGSQLCSTW